MSDILQRADAIAGQDRSRDYGHPHPNHERICTFWNALFQSKGFRDRLTVRDIPVMMMLLKIARHVHSPKDDNLVDIAGYVKCLAIIDECEASRRNGVNGPSMDEAFATENEPQPPFNDVPTVTTEPPTE